MISFKNKAKTFCYKEYIYLNTKVKGSKIHDYKLNLSKKSSFVLIIGENIFFCTLKSGILKKRHLFINN